MKIFEIMGRMPVTTKAEESLSSAAQKMKRYSVSVLTVVGERGKFRGILTDRDIVLRAVASGEDLFDTRVGDVMTRRIVPLSSGDDVVGAARLMAGLGVQQMPVVDEGRAVGMLSLSDLAKHPGSSAEFLRVWSGNSHRKSGKLQ